MQMHHTTIISLPITQREKIKAPGLTSRYFRPTAHGTQATNQRSKYIMLITFFTHLDGKRAHLWTRHLDQNRLTATTPSKTTKNPVCRPTYINKTTRARSHINRGGFESYVGRHELHTTRNGGPLLPLYHPQRRIWLKTYLGRRRKLYRKLGAWKPPQRRTAPITLSPATEATINCFVMRHGPQWRGRI